MIYYSTYATEDSYSLPPDNLPMARMSDFTIDKGGLVTDEANLDGQIHQCGACSLIFKTREQIQHHTFLAHREGRRSEDRAINQDYKAPQRRAIACVACARAKTKCDKTIPSCSRCVSKGLVCEARCTKRSTDAAYRLAKRQLSLYRRPIPIMSAQNRIALPSTSNWVPSRSISTSGAPMTDSKPIWDLFTPQSWSIYSSASTNDPGTPPHSSTYLGTPIDFLGGYNATPYNFPLAQPSPNPVHSTPELLEVDYASQPPTLSPSFSAKVARPVATSFGPDLSTSMSFCGYDSSSSFGEIGHYFAPSNEGPHGIPTPLSTPDFPKTTLSNSSTQVATFQVTE